MAPKIGDCEGLVRDEERQERERAKIEEARADIAEALKQLDVNVSHYEIRLAGKRWRMTALCERGRWITAPTEWGPKAIASRVARIARCCPNGKMPRVEPTTVREVERYGGLRSVSKATRQAVIARDGLICKLCGLAVVEREVHIDHRVPVARGGDSHVLNLQVTHRICNLQKGTKMVGGEWGEKDQSESVLDKSEQRQNR